METLKFLLQSKQADVENPHDVVVDAVEWMRSQFLHAGISFHFTDGGAGLGAYGYFQLKSLFKDTAITLHLKIAEINRTPYAFAEVRIRGQHESILFPFFGEIGTDEGKLTMLTTSRISSSAPRRTSVPVEFRRGVHGGDSAICPRQKSRRSLMRFSRPWSPG